MDIVTWAKSLLHQYFDLIPMQMALSTGLPLFALSLVYRKPLVTLPAGPRRKTLVYLGIAGSIAVLTSDISSQWIAEDGSFWATSNWWQRPISLAVAALVVIAAAFALRNIPLPSPGELTISPRRHWWAFSPRNLLWVIAVLTAFLLLTLAWHIAEAVNMTNNLSQSWVGSDYPLIMMPTDVNGWQDHLATLLALAAAAIALLLSLGADANRPIFARSSALDAREERTATARMFVLVTLGGLVLTIGAVLSYIGFTGQHMVVAYDTRIEKLSDYSTSISMTGDGYGSIAYHSLLLGGYVVQGIGAALLLRIVLDTARAAIATRAGKQPQPDAGTVALTSEASR